MMKIHCVKFFQFFLMALCCVSCQGELDDLNFIYKADVSEIVDSVQFDDLVNDYNLIPLQMTDKYGIGEISDLIVTDSMFYVVSDGIYCFNKKGEYKFAINRKGHAHNEYVQITSVNIYDGQIFLYDVMQKKILVFDSSNGSYMKNIGMPHVVSELFCNGKNIIADRSSLACTLVANDERFFVCSQDNPVYAQKAFKKEPEYKIPIEGQISFYEEGLFFSDFWRCKTWKIDEEKCAPYFCVNFSPEISLSVYEIDQMIQAGRISPDHSNDTQKAWGLVNIHENDRIISGDISVGSTSASIIYYKETGKTVVYKDVSREGPWEIKPMNFISAYKNKIYKVLSSDDICLIRSIFQVPVLPKQSSDKVTPYEVFCSVEENDGPVIVEYTLK